MPGPDDHLTLQRTWQDALRTPAERVVLAPAVVAALARPARFVKRLTGADLDTAQRWRVAGTDLGIPYLLENGSVGFLFGDTFDTAWPETGDNDWRSPVMLRSNVHPGSPGGIVFDSAARVAGDGRAPQLMDYEHGHPAGCDWPDHEVTRIPNDAVSFPETGRQVLSYMSVNCWKAPWRTRHAGLAWSDNGNDFVVAGDAVWPNGQDNRDPFQMWTMQRDGAHVYVFSVRSGRQAGPMMLRRVPWQRILEPAAYEDWGWRKGSGWRWGQPCTPILEGTFGEPSVRRLRDGTWAMAYLDAAAGRIVTRRADGPDRVWSEEKVQVTAEQEPNLYGGFLHPYSTSALDDLHLLVSTWRRDPADPARTTAYHVSQYVGTL